MRCLCIHFDTFSLSQKDTTNKGKKNLFLFPYFLKFFVIMRLNIIKEEHASMKEWKDDLRKQSLMQRLNDLKQALNTALSTDEQSKIKTQVRAIERCLTQPKGGYQR